MSLAAGRGGRGWFGRGAVVGPASRGVCRAEVEVRGGGVRSHERARRRPPMATALAHARPASSGRRWYQLHAQATARGMTKVPNGSSPLRNHPLPRGCGCPPNGGFFRRGETPLGYSGGGEENESGTCRRSGRLLSPPVVRIALRLAAHVGSALYRSVGLPLVLGPHGRSSRTGTRTWRGWANFSVKSSHHGLAHPARCWAHCWKLKLFSP